MISNTIFGRGDSDGVVRMSELICLWNMLYEGNVDTGSHLIRHLVKVGKATKGDIVVGGIITFVAETLGYETGDLEVVAGKHSIDLEVCLATKMIVRDGNSFCFVRKNMAPLRLPNPH